MRLTVENGDCVGIVSESLGRNESERTGDPEAPEAELAVVERRQYGPTQTD